jgi:dihydroxyacetone kinase-like predicted kinase
MLDALAEVVTGRAADAALRAASTAKRSARLHADVTVPRESGSLDFAYEVQYLLDAEPDTIDTLRTVLSGLGDSLVIVGAAGSPHDDAVRTWNVHVHVNDVGAAIEAGIEAGRPSRLSVTRFADQIAYATGDNRSAEPPVRAERGVVVIAEGTGMARILRDEGAVAVGTGHPSTEDMLAAIRSTGRDDVIVLPDNGNHAVAESAAALAREDGFRVSVIPVRSPVQALAALAVRDGSRRFDDDVIAMAEAAGACRHAEITVAAHAALTSVGQCGPGDYLGLVDSDVVLIGRELDAMLCTMTDRLCSTGAELVTIVAGSDLPAGSRERLADHLSRQWPLVDVQVLDGGQPRHLVWIGAE